MSRSYHRLPCWKTRHSCVEDRSMANRALRHKIKIWANHADTEAEPEPLLYEVSDSWDWREYGRAIWHQHWTYQWPRIYTGRPRNRGIVDPTECDLCGPRAWKWKSK